MKEKGGRQRRKAGPGKRYIIDVRRGIILILVLMAVCMGCSPDRHEETDTEDRESGGSEQQETAEESENLAEGYREIYEQAAEQGLLDSSDLKQDIIEYLGGMGYAAVDAENQINMANYRQVEEFCVKAGEGENTETTIFTVLDKGGFVRYDMEAENGGIHVAVSTLQWEENRPRVCWYHEFEACTWKYTEKGYLFIEEYHPRGYDGAPGETAFRVKPLDQKCREFSRKYVYPIGYSRNNMLITDWNEQDYSELELYDLYEIFYYLKYGEYVPYEAYEGAEYEIPAGEFEEIIQEHFHITREQIAANTIYYPDRDTYRYRPRWLHDSEEPYEPYAEVVDFREQDDGTVRLWVEAVWEEKMTDRAVTSELVVRPLENGGFSYVSNQVISWDESLESCWYSPRLTDEEWEKWN